MITTCIVFFVFSNPTFGEPPKHRHAIITLVQVFRFVRIEDEGFTTQFTQARRGYVSLFFQHRYASQSPEI
jgi:hypothetical protein